MEGILKKKAASIIQHGEKWCGLKIELTGKRGRALKGVELDADKSIEDLKAMCGESPCGLALSSSAGYIIHLKFPFSGRRKIGMVIRGELEGVLPFPLDDVVFDFREFDKGSVIAAAVPSSLLEKRDRREGIKSVSMSSLTALYALRWFGAIDSSNFLFLHLNEGVAVVMTFVGDSLYSLRQFMYGDEPGRVMKELREMANAGGMAIDTCYLVGSDDEVSDRMRKENGLNLTVHVPSPAQCCGIVDAPSWFWAGMGSALLALDPGKEVNLTGATSIGYPALTGKTLFVAAIVAAVSVILAGLSFLNLTLKSGALKYLSSEQTRIYKTVFPKAPPVKDVVGAFEGKLRGIGGKAGGSPEGAASWPLKVLSEISSRIDSQIDVKLSEYVCDEREFMIAGTTVSFAATDRIKAALEQVRGIRGVEILGLEPFGDKQVKFRMRGKF